jgi:hypothetical protein
MDVGRSELRFVTRLFSVWRDFKAHKIDRAGLRIEAFDIKADFGRWRADAAKCADRRASPLARHLGRTVHSAQVARGQTMSKNPEQPCNTRQETDEMNRTRGLRAWEWVAICVGLFPSIVTLVWAATRDTWLQIQQDIPGVVIGAVSIGLLTSALIRRRNLAKRVDDCGGPRAEKGGAQGDQEHCGSHTK